MEELLHIEFLKLIKIGEIGKLILV